MKATANYEEGKIVSITLLAENEAEAWFLNQEIILGKHCDEEDCKSLKKLVMKK